MKEITMVINSNGTIHSLYSDFFADFEGDKHIERASEVEFCDKAQAWVVTILQGVYKGCCLPMLFNKRQDAIDAEIQFFNNELFS